FVPAIAACLVCCSPSDTKDTRVSTLFAPQGGLEVPEPDRQHYYGSVPRSISVSYKDRLPQGTWTIFDEKGNSVVELTFDHGICTGVWTMWDDAFLHKQGLQREEL